MKGHLLLAVVICAVVFYFFRPAPDVATAQETIAVPRAQLYAKYDALFAAIERKAATVGTVTGTPPIPVKFSFARHDGEMLDMAGTAGFRTVELKVWLADGARPGETVLNVMASPESMLQKTGDTEVQRQVETILYRVDEQLVEGHRVTALFGEGPNAPSAERGN